MRRAKGPSDAVRYSHLGIQFALVVILGIWAGAQLDKKLSTNFFTLVGTFVGAGIGFYFLHRETRRVADPDEEVRTDDDAGKHTSSTKDPGHPDRGHDSPGGRSRDSDEAPGR